MAGWIVHHVDATTDEYYGPFADPEEAKGKALSAFDDCIDTSSSCEVTLIPLQTSTTASASMPA